MCKSLTAQLQSFCMHSVVVVFDWMLYWETDYFYTFRIFNSSACSEFFQSGLGLYNKFGGRLKRTAVFINIQACQGNMTALWRLFILEVYFSCKCLILKNGGLKHSFLLTWFFFFLNKFLTTCAAAITPLVWTWQTPSWFLPRKRSVKCSGSVWVGKENPTPGALCGKTSRRISGAGTPTLPNPCLKFVGCVWKLENHRKSELKGQNCSCQS